MLDEAELIRLAADMPLLSSGLRERVLGAAFEAQRRRAQGRRMLWGATLMIAGLGLAAWNRSLWGLGEFVAGIGVSSATAAEPYATEGPPLLPVSQRYGRGERLLSAGGDDWQMVEAEMHSRDEGSRRIGVSF
ncbi:MAG: hypothetical protein ACKV0T_23345 [Planctomycetales bacterium]